MKFLSLMVIGLFSFSGFTSSGVGNGGDALVCEDGRITLLDVYEAEKLGFDLDFNGLTNRSEIALDIVERLMVKDRGTALKLKEYALEMIVDFDAYDLKKQTHGERIKFKGKNIYISSDTVGEINDSKHRTLPAGCVVKQLVSQIKKRRARENRYEFNSVLWNKLSVEDQAMTILHEAWYRILLEGGAKDSEGARYMNALLASVQYSQMNFVEYFEELQTTKMKYYIVYKGSSLFFDETFTIDLKEHELVIDKENNQVCAPNMKVKANIKKVAPVTVFHMGLVKFKFKKICFRNSHFSMAVMPNKLKQKRINFVMESFLIRTNAATDGVLSFHDNGALKGLHGFSFQAAYRLFYNCNGKQVYKKEGKCKGPYRDTDTKLKTIKDKELLFDEKEKPLLFNHYNTLE